MHHACWPGSSATHRVSEKQVDKQVHVCCAVDMQQLAESCTGPAAVSAALHFGKSKIKLSRGVVSSNAE